MGSARNRAVHVLSERTDELWFTPYSQGTSPGGAFGLRWPLRGAVRAGHESVSKGEAFVSIDFEEVLTAYQAGQRKHAFRFLK